MQHNVTMTKKESRVIEEWQTMEAKRYLHKYHNRKTGKDVYVDGEYLVVGKKDINKEPTLQEIAQFLSETKADFVSVEHNYRFVDLPFC